MESSACRAQTRWFALSLLGILLASGLLRLYRINAPVVDGFWDRQVAYANKSRAMAGPPFHLLNGSYDFLPESGKRVECTEEIPVYFGLLAVGYRAFGEQDWFARTVSLVGCLVALGAFCGLVRREYDERFALVATILLASCPLLVFYGRDVVADVWMIAAILLAVYCYRRAEDSHRLAWIIASGFAVLLAAGFKYYGLIALVPIAELAYRRHGLRAALHHELWLPALVAMLPVAWWMVAVFFATANPTGSFTYFFFQKPSSVGLLIYCFFSRFLWKSCGPVLVGLMLAGVFATITRRQPTTRCLWSWTFTGWLYYLLLAPAAVGQEYYGLILLPAAALWGATGWTWLFASTATREQTSRFALRAGILVLFLAVAVHSPWIMRSRFRENRGMVLAGQRLNELCSPTGRVVAGPQTPQPIVHYAHREGWFWQDQAFPDWSSRLAHYRDLGAEYVVVYFDHKTNDQQRQMYAPMLASLPVVEHRTGPNTRSEIAYEYYILSLRDARLADRQTH
jgi:hypothetical protein